MSRKPGGVVKTARRLSGYEVVTDAKNAIDVLWSIAIDPHSPAGARVLAAKTILQDARNREKPPCNGNEGAEPEMDPISARAIQIMADLRKKAN
jgi:hypothetical protein